jgi:3-hydroxyisobutyrate dehydrogenase
MGLPMATNLLKAGHEVTGFDRQQEAMDVWVAAGGQKASDLQHAGSDQDIVITMLQTGQQAQAVCLGETGLFASMLPRALFIDCSSIDVPTSRILHEQAQAHNLVCVDAPVSGGVSGAVAGKLTFMVGGTDAAFALAQPILAHMGQKIIHTGCAGTGQAAKICNNMILGISMIAVCESFKLAESLGLSHEKLFDVVNNASGQCWVMNHYTPVSGLLENVPANRGYEPGFTSAMMLKDLNLSQQSAKTFGIPTPLAKHAAQLYQQLCDSGKGALDFSCMFEFNSE